MAQGQHQSTPTGKLHHDDTGKPTRTRPNSEANREHFVSIWMENFTACFIGKTFVAEFQGFPILR